jgi:hypothetical protein
MPFEENTLAFCPWQFTEIDTGGMPINDVIMPMPYRDISPVMMQLMESLVQSAQRLAGTMDIQVGEGRQDAPVGTTIALIEAAFKPTSATLKRMHVAQGREIQLLAKLLAEDPEAKYPYRINGKIGQAFAEDFSPQGPVDYVPVSDPNAPTQTQRLTLAQAGVTMAEKAPTLYDARAVHEWFWITAGVQQNQIDQFMPPKQQAQPMDPVSENMAAMTGKPIAVGISQNHAAHLRVHFGALKTPGVMQTPAGPALMAHIQEHAADLYWTRMNQAAGGKLPPPGQPMPPPVESQIALMAANSTDQAVQKLQAELGPIVGDMQGDQGAAAAHASLQEATIKSRDNAEANAVKREDMARKGQTESLQNETEMFSKRVELVNDREEREAQARNNATQLRIAEIGLETARLGVEKAQHQTEAAKHRAQQKGGE